MVINAVENTYAERRGGLCWRNERMCPDKQNYRCLILPLPLIFAGNTLKGRVGKKPGVWSLFSLLARKRKSHKPALPV